MADTQELIDVVDSNRVLVGTEPRGEPQLSRHAIEGAMPPGLLGRGNEPGQALFRTLPLCDGSYSLLGVAERAALPFAPVAGTAEALLGAGLLREEP